MKLRLHSKNIREMMPLFLSVSEKFYFGLKDHFAFKRDVCGGYS